MLHTDNLQFVMSGRNTHAVKTIKKGISSKKKAEGSVRKSKHLNPKALAVITDIVYRLQRSDGSGELELSPLVDWFNEVGGNATESYVSSQLVSFFEKKKVIFYQYTAPI